MRHRRRAHGSMPILCAVELVRERAELAVPVVLHDLLLQARHLQEKRPPSRAAVRGQVPRPPATSMRRDVARCGEMRRDAAKRAEPRAH